MAQLILTDGTIKKVEPENGTDFSLDELYNMLECDTVEVIYLNNEAYHNHDPEEFIMIGDEEAGLLSEPIVNVKATQIYRKSWTPHAQTLNIVGNILLCKSKMFK